MAWARGCVCLNGHGGVQDLAIRNRPATTALPDGHGSGDAAFALLHIKGPTPVTRLLEGRCPSRRSTTRACRRRRGRRGGHEGLPRFAGCTFENRYPFGRVLLEDPQAPPRAAVTGWSPFVPLDDVHSGLPCAILEYTFENRSAQTVAFEFSYHLSHLAVRPGKKSVTGNAVIGPCALGRAGRPAAGLLL